MKRFISVLSSLLVLPAFAEVAPVYYDEIVEYTDEMLADEENGFGAEETVAQRNTINRSTSASRAVSSATNSGSSRTSTSSRAMATSPRTSVNTARGTTSRTARKTNVVNRPSSTSSRTSVTARGTKTAKPVTARVSLRNTGLPADKTTPYVTKSLKANQNYIDSDGTLYNASNTSDTSRVSVAYRSPSTGVRLSTANMAATPVITEEDVSSTTSTLTAIAELTDYCKAQYAACMDNYCNVLDDNQGRCTCSKNLKNYEKTENALEAATEQFQEAIQKIRYIGLTGAQIESLFAETEAELAMKSNSDSSQLKNSLDAIKRKVIDVSTPNASSSYEVTSGLSLDLNGLLNADFTSGFDLDSFLGSTKNTNTTSVSNQRGEQLYKTATNRCKTAVLNSCTAQGIDANVITNSYDLEIDKQCIAYERALTEANKEMKNNVFNATNILQQARLLLTQNKNSYDLRGCVAAIDSCMQDEYVCGSDYELCLDPTGKYIANGEVIKGSTPGVSGGQTITQDDVTSAGGYASWTSGGMYNLYATWNYTDSGSSKNAWSKGQSENLGGYVREALNTWKSDYDSKDPEVENMAFYLLQKIGYIDNNDKVHGMCASVMKQCQDYTFQTKSNKNGSEYILDNEVIRMYLNTTLAKIKVQQDALLSDYAEGCRGDVQSCLSSNGYDDSNTTSTASRTAISSCAAEITTCMSVSGYTPKDGTKLTLRAMNDWVSSILISCPANTYLDDTVTTTTNDGVTTQTASAQCLPCESKPSVDASGNVLGQYGTGAIPIPTYSTGGQVTRCTCADGYEDVLENEMEDGTPTGRMILTGCRAESSGN